jgi:hypothetical protein
LLCYASQMNSRSCAAEKSKELIRFSSRKSFHRIEQQRGAKLINDAPKENRARWSYVELTTPICQEVTGDI